MTTTLPTPTSKLSALLIGPEDNLMRECKEMLAAIGGIYICNHTYIYPSPAEVSQLVAEFSPDTIVISLADYNQVCRSVGRLTVEHPRLPVIAVHNACDQGLLLDLMQLGIRELWFPPLKIEQMRSSVNRLLQHKLVNIPAGQGGSLIAFLPARGGCGTTTIALNTAGALQQLKSSILLADLDFHNSIIAFWLKLDTRHGFHEALERAQWLDPVLWRSIVHPIRGVDILTSSQAGPPVVISGPETNAVIDYAVQNYEFVLVDLPEAIYSSCWEVLGRARSILLVVTPEMASLYLARRKLEQLVGHGIPKENVQVLLNRCSHLDVQVSEVEKFLSLPVLSRFGNQYKTVTTAFADGKFVPVESKLGTQFARLARALAGMPLQPEGKPAGMFKKIFSPA